MKKAACVLLVREDGKFLGASRRGEPNNMNLVGGKVDPGETVEVAAHREFLEETGINLSPENFQKVFSEPCLGETNYETTAFLVYQNQDSAALQIPEVPDSPEKGIEIKWITWDELLNPSNSFYSYNLNLYNKVKNMLKQHWTF